MPQRPCLASPAELLARAQRHDASRPFVTYYDLGAGARVELSVATFDNWTAKTAGLLADEFDVEPGAQVSVVLPAHWLSLVWAQAVWTVGARLVLTDTAQAAVRVRAVDEPHDVAGELVVVSTLPMGGPAGQPVPAGALDYGREVLGYPDVFAAPAHEMVDGLVARLLAAAPLEDAGRRLVVADRLDEGLLTDGLLGPLVTGGSVVLVRPGADAAETDVAAAVAAIAADERATTGLR